MQYRLYNAADFDRLYAIEMVCFKPPIRFTRGYMQRLVQAANGATWIAENEDRMAGFAIVEWTRQDDGLIAYLQTIEVRPEARGLGVGGELLRRVENSARQAGATLLWLHVEARNDRALRLYEAHGFRSIGRTENYYGRDRAALVYEKPLKRAKASSS